MANPMTPHCERFGCEFFTSYGEPMEACKRCGNPKGHATPDREARVTPATPLICDRCGGEWTVAQAEGRPYSCPNDCYMGPRWQTLDGVPYFTKSSQAYPLKAT